MVRALAVAVDRIRQPAAAPRGDLDDLAAGGDDLAGGAVDDRLALVVRDVRAEDEHEFVAAHARSHSFQWGCPVDGTAGTERKGNGAESSTRPGRSVGAARPMYPLTRPRPIATCRPSRGGSVPASTILLLESDPTAAESIATDPDRRRLHGHADGRCRRGFAARRRAPARHHRRRRPVPKAGGRHLPRDPRHAGDGRRARPVRQRDRRRRGADRASSRPAPTTSSPGPFDTRELEARVEALLLRFQRSQGPRARSSSTDGLTLHRAAADGRGLQPQGRRRDDDHRHEHRARRRRPPARTRSSWSTSTSSSAASRRHLNLDPKQTLADVVRDEAALREPELLRTYAMRHDSGLHVLAAPAAPEAAEQRHARPRRRRSCGRCSRATTLVVIDAGSTLDERALTIFEAAETVLLPVTPEIAALKAMHALLEYLNEAGSVGLEVDVRAQQPLRPRHPQAARRRERPRARKSRSTCRTTRSSTSRRSTRACRSSSGPPGHRRRATDEAEPVAFGEEGYPGVVARPRQEEVRRTVPPAGGRRVGDRAGVSRGPRCSSSSARFSPPCFGGSQA